MNQPAGAPRTPPRPQHSQLTNISGTPHSQTVSSLGSEQYRQESVDPILQFEWDRYTATGAACEAILKGLFPNTPPPPSEATAKKLLRDLEQALSMQPEPAQYAPIATLCNDILTGHYASNRPTIDRPARWFVPLGHAILESDFAQRKPDIVVVIRSEWEEYVRVQLEENPIAQRRQSKGWKEVFPEWQTVDPRIRNLLLNPSLLHAADLDPQLLRALGIHPPWECIVAIMEFKVSNSPDPTTSISPSVSSNSTNAAEAKPKPGPKSKESSNSATPGRVLRSPQSPSAEQGTPRPASKGASSSQNGGAKKSLSTPPASKKTLTPEVQLLSYFCEVMSASRYRGWTSGAIVSGTDFSLVTCDREGAIKSAPTSLRTADGVETFAQWVLAVGSGTLAEMGFSTIFGQTDGRIEGVCFSVPDNAQRASESSIQLKFGKQYYQQYGAFGRGTTLYRVDITMGNREVAGVCKISWPVATRESEYDLIQQARKIDPVHLPEVICAWDDAEGVLPSRTLRSLCPQTAVEYELRVLRIVLSPFYGPIHELEGDEFREAFWDIMICNVKLYEANSVHHRDSSVNNMMYARNKHGRVVGILSDFDLAVSMTRSVKPSSAHRSGTAPFMALDLLGLKPCSQDLEHDFEAALYILLWVALGYKGWKPPPTGDHLSSWRRGTWAQIQNAKLGVINADLEEDAPYLLNLVTPEYQVLRRTITYLHLNIQERTYNKKRARMAKRYQDPENFAGGPTTMTAQKFFDILGPPPPGREPYSQIKTSETGSKA